MIFTLLRHYVICLWLIFFHAISVYDATVDYAPLRCSLLPPLRCSVSMMRARTGSAAFCAAAAYSRQRDDARKARGALDITRRTMLIRMPMPMLMRRRYAASDPRRGDALPRKSVVPVHLRRASLRGVCERLRYYVCCSVMRYTRTIMRRARGAAAQYARVYGVAADAITPMSLFDTLRCCFYSESIITITNNE